MSDTVRSAEAVMNDKAVYWAVRKFNENGEPVFEAPVEIECYWRKIQEVYVDRMQNQQVSNAKVIVDRDVDLDGQLWQGELQFLHSLIPNQNPGAYAIRKFDKIPDRRGTKFYREATL